MWLEAMDLLLDRISKDVAISKIRGISGCAQVRLSFLINYCVQQHGTVYWARNAGEKLGSLEEKQTFGDGLKGVSLSR